MISVISDSHKQLIKNFKKNIANSAGDLRSLTYIVHTYEETSRVLVEVFRQLVCRGREKQLDDQVDHQKLITER